MTYAAGEIIRRERVHNKAISKGGDPECSREKY